MIVTVIGILAIAWGAATLLVGLLKPQAVWQMGKIQGFVSLLSETGTTIFFVAIGLAAIGLGLWLLL